MLTDDMTAFMSEDSIEFFVFYPPDEPEGEDYVWLVVVYIGRCFDDGGELEIQFGDGNAEPLADGRKMVVNLGHLVFGQAEICSNGL